MSSADHTYRLLGAFAQELARCGMRHACTSPGSRNAPLIVALAREPGLRCHSHVDERCAGFFALGLAKATATPVAVACTSGTAAAELLPAAIEAREARVPLLLLTADRPAELRDNGAGQAVDQLGLYGRAAKWFVEVSVHEAAEAELRWIRTLACRAYWTALEARPGVVHLNFPLREPLVTDEPPPPDATARADGAPFVRRAVSRAAGPDDAHAVAAALAGARRGVLVAGRHERSTPLGAAASAFAEGLGWPLLADPLSGARRGGAAIAHYDAILRVGSVAEELRPDAVVRVGDLPVSKPLRTWLGELGDASQIALDPEGAWQDPASVLERSFAVEPAHALRALAAGEPGGALRRAEEGWLRRWLDADGRAARAIAEELAAGTLGEPAVAATLGQVLDEGTTLFLASSMPVRDVESFWPVREAPPRVLCNRGANGIDGTVSSAFGAAAAGQGPVVLLIGDVALAHDVGGLLAASRLGLPLTIVLLDNGGGGIFDFLPVASSRLARQAPGGGRQEAGDIYAEHIATPTGLDFAAAAALYGFEHERVGDAASLRQAIAAALERPAARIIEIRGDRAGNVETHARLWRAVSEALLSR